MSFHSTTPQASGKTKRLDPITPKTKQDAWQYARVVTKLNVEAAAHLRTHLSEVFEEASSWSELATNLRSLGYRLSRADAEVWVSDAHSNVHICTSAFLGFSVGALKNRFGRTSELLAC